MTAIRIVCCLSIGLALAIPAFAADTSIPEPGTRYRVVAVARNDRLNVRSSPGADADIVGSFAPDAVDIVVTGSRQVIGQSNWWEVAYPLAERGSGWVSAAFLRSDGPTEDTNYPLNCGGTEPFWSLVTGAGQAMFSLFGEDQHTFDASPWIEAQGLRGHFVVRLQEGSQTIGPKGYIVVVRDFDFCSDGMSDTDFPFNATLVLPNGEVFGGCCSRSVH